MTYVLLKVVKGKAILGSAQGFVTRAGAKFAKVSKEMKFKKDKDVRYVVRKVR